MALELCEPAASTSSIDDAVALELPSSVHKGKNAAASFNQDDLWTAACNGYEQDDGMPPGLSDELTSVVSMVTSLHEGSKHAEASFTSGLHRNASFDSGSTSHDSCTASFSAGSPVTVLPPLPYYSSGDVGLGNKRTVENEQESSYAHYYVDGIWTPHDLASDCDQMLDSTAGGRNFSLLMNELPLRSSYDDGVDQICVSSDYHLDCMVPPISSHHNHHSSVENSGSSPESRPKVGIESESSFCQEFLVGLEDSSDASECHAAGIGNSVSHSSPLPATAAVPATAESEVSPAARRRLSWSDHQWPTTNSQATQAFFNNSAESRLPQQFVNGFNVQAMTNFQDADYIATCKQFHNSQLQQSPLIGPENSLKRSYSAMQVPACIASSAASHSFLEYAASAAPNQIQRSNRHQQDAAALNALLYKNNNTGSQGVELIQQNLQGSDGFTARVDAILPPPKLRRRHGTATDPQSIAARTRRERFSDRIRLLQSLVPNGERLDTVSMLGHTLEYVRFLQHQVWQLYNGNDDCQPDSESREKWKEFMDTTQTLASAS